MLGVGAAPLLPTVIAADMVVDIYVVVERSLVDLIVKQIQRNLEGQMEYLRFYRTLLISQFYKQPMIPD